VAKALEVLPDVPIAGVGSVKFVKTYQLWPTHFVPELLMMELSDCRPPLCSRKVSPNEHHSAIRSLAQA
jgi:hypothetical protein